MTLWKAFAAAFFALCLVSVASAADLTVSAAASLKDAMTDIASQYKAAGGDNITFVFGSSGQLATQIQDGAPVDVYVSAADKQVDDLVKAGLADPATRRIIAGNALVLIVPAGAKDAPAGFSALADPRIAKVAIGDPKSVPAGDYALQTLTALHIADKLTDRLIYATNVRQVLAYVEDADVSAGIVYATDARQSGDKVKVVALADEKTHAPIVYPAILIKASQKPDAARRFLDYLVGDQAQKVLRDKGFAPGNSGPVPASVTAAPTR